MIFCFNWFLRAVRNSTLIRILQYFFQQKKCWYFSSQGCSGMLIDNVRAKGVPLENGHSGHLRITFLVDGLNKDTLQYSLMYLKLEHASNKGLKSSTLWFLKIEMPINVVKLNVKSWNKKSGTYTAHQLKEIFRSHTKFFRCWYIKFWQLQVFYRG